ncbi:MAG: hypothetical protein K2L90_09340 [Muribaculaceae bacterium]|nr:hypothetical protein [Muribaculaceae bacterium]
MTKKLLLSLGAAVLAVSASATTYKLGEAFAYKIDPSFEFTWIDAQYPVNELMGQASLEYGFGMASAWFSQMLADNKNDEGINTMCPVVEDPWNTGSYVVRMQTSRWDAFGNFNFALPQMNEPSRIRVIYRVDPTGVENAWYNGGQKPFAVKLMDDADQDTPDYPELTELNEEFWNNQGWRVADFVDDLKDENHYISLLWNAAGLSCGRNVPFYVKEVSVVPLSKLQGYTAPEGNKSLSVVAQLPDLVNIDPNAGGDDGMYQLGEAFCYDIDPSFAFTWIDAQYPVNELMGQASLEYGFGMASAWFSQMLADNKNDEGINTMCPVVEDPWNTGSYVVRMQTSRWDAFGNFNFALPQMNEPSRIRVIYRVDPTGVENAWYNGGQKPFAVKLMDDADQDTPDYPELTELNEEFWNNQGWRVADFVDDLKDENHYISLLWNAAGLSCGRNVPFYVKEVSVVPLSKLTDYTVPEGDKALTVLPQLPELVKVDRNGGAGVESVGGELDSVSVVGMTGAVTVNGFEGVVEVYNLVGQLTAKANVDGAAEIAVPAGVAIVKAGNVVAKVIVR